MGQEAGGENEPTQVVNLVGDEEQGLLSSFCSRKRRNSKAIWSRNRGCAWCKRSTFLVGGLIKEALCIPALCGMVRCLEKVAPDVSLHLSERMGENPFRI